LFSIPKNRKKLLQLFKDTVVHVGHPLNVIFLDKLLRNLPMAERDFSWTEFVRENYSEFKVEIKKFEKNCRVTNSFSEILKHRFCLTAQYFFWFLPSTNKPLRYITTRALYWFGRRFPEKLFEHVSCILRSNNGLTY